MFTSFLHIFVLTLFSNKRIFCVYVVSSTFLKRHHELALRIVGCIDMSIEFRDHIFRLLTYNYYAQGKNPRRSTTQQVIKYAKFIANAFLCYIRQNSLRDFFYRIRCKSNLEITFCQKLSSNGLLFSQLFKLVLFSIA